MRSSDYAISFWREAREAGRTDVPARLRARQRFLRETISCDEDRHGGTCLQYMGRALKQEGAGVAAAFARTGFLMASSQRSDKALHPINPHVNETLFPNDTIQSRLPKPEWLQHWLDEQIRFDGS